MKLLVESSPAAIEPLLDGFELPDGLIGLAEFRRAALAASPEQLPFRWLNLVGPAGGISFVVIEPGGIVEGYAPVLFAADAAALGIHDPADAIILNIVKLAAETPDSATVNLVGPIVVNRRTRIGRQLVIANYADYDAAHVLVAAADQSVAVGG